MATPADQVAKAILALPTYYAKIKQRVLMEDSMKKILLIFSVLLLFSLLVLLMGASATKSLVIDVAEDTYVVADLNDPEDALGFMSKNYGDLDFVKAWYIWNVEVQEMTPTEEEEEETEEEEVPPEEEEMETGG